MKAENNPRLAAARLLLGRGIRYTIKDAPFLYRLFRLNRLTVSHLRAGTIIEISRLIDEYGLADARKPSDVNLKLDVVARIIAVAVLNRKNRIRLFTDRLTKFLLWKVPAQLLSEIYFRIAPINSIQDFMIITKYFEVTASRMMNPKNLGQKTKGS